jgi:hypothetical protein
MQGSLEKSIACPLRYGFSWPPCWPGFFKVSLSGVLGGCKIKIIGE